MKLEDYYDKKTGKFDCGKISNLPDQSFDDYMDILIQAGLDEEYNRQDIEWETERQKYQQTLTMLRDTRKQLETQVASREQEIKRRLVEVYKH